jgi:fatty acid desaturase
MKHHTLNKIVWKDLVHLNLWEIFVENNITLPWLIASWLLAYYELYPLALACSFFLFLTGLRQAHNAFHNALGTHYVLTKFSMVLNSLILLASMHAVKHTHLLHHKHCLTDEDLEGKCAQMSALKALFYGPVHIYKIHMKALFNDNWTLRLWTLSELGLIATFITTAFIFNINFLIYHCIVMAIGELTSAFFAVWTVHHDCDEEYYARTLNNKWKNRLTYNMFYHWEHHQFPAVPTIKLPELAKRIQDQSIKNPIKQVF